MNYLLGIDIGTSGTKSVLFDTNGQAIASNTAEYPLYQPHNGWAEQDPSDWWRGVCSSVKAVTANVDKHEIAGVGLSGQMHGLVMLDGSGNVLRRSIIWCDQRTAAECEEITQKIGREKLIDITANPALTGFTASKILWVRNNEPEVYEKCRKVLLPKDYIRYMLTGEYATEVSDASGMQLMDIKKRTWSDEVLQKLGIDKAWLGEMHESFEISGVVSSRAAEETGLLAGTPVAGGAGDQAAGAVGNGIVKSGIISSTIGTSGVVFAHTDTPVIDKLGRVHTFCHAVPGAWHIMGVTQGAGLSLKWFRDNFCSAEMETADSLGCDPYVLMDKEAATVPAGANGIVYLPYLMGERTPHLDPDARGVFFGLSAIHTKKDMLRAVMEGVTFSLRDCLEIIRATGITVDEVRASGGGGKSPLWRQIQADVFGSAVKTVNSGEGPALGVALLAGVGAGVYSSVPQACEAVIKAEKVQAPNMENNRIYQGCYSLYTSLYPALKDTFKELQHRKA
jgi:xylulokinase